MSLPSDTLRRKLHLPPDPKDLAGNSTPNFLQGSELLQTVSLAVLLCLAVVVTVANIGVSYDDAFITYRYAFNLATGQGYVYNPGQQYLGITAPLYGLVLGGLGFITQHPAQIPIYSNILSGISLFCTGWGLFRLAENHKQGMLGLIAGLIYMSLPGLHLVIGCEMIVQVALFTWATVSIDEGKYGSATLFACLAIMTRPDGLAFAPILLGYALVKRPHMRGKQLGILIGSLAITVCFFLWLKLYFGVFLPESIGQKTREAALGRPGLQYLPQCCRLLQLFFFTDRWHAVGGGILFCLGIVGVFFVKRSWFFLPAVGWVVLSSIGYIAIKAPAYMWYLPSLYFAVSILASCAIYSFAMWHRITKWVSLGLVGLFVACNAGRCCSWGHTEGIFGARKALYVAAGQWLDANSPRVATAMVVELGWIGYYGHHLLVLDTPGIVVPGRPNATEIVMRYHPDVIVLEPLTYEDVYHRYSRTDWFHDFVPAVNISYQKASYGPKPLVIFIRKTRLHSFRYAKVAGLPEFVDVTTLVQPQQEKPKPRRSNPQKRSGPVGLATTSTRLP